MIFFEAVAATFKFGKITVDARVVDRLTTNIFFEIWMGNISTKPSAIVN